MTRPAVYLTMIAAVLAACESDLQVEQAAIQWLEWPAEVRAETPFQARAILVPPVCFPHVLKPRVTTDQAAVTLSPYFLVQQTEPVCPPTVLSVSPLPNITLDTAFTMPGLAASSPRTYEMRATVPPDPAANTAPGYVPVRTFGDVSVRLADPDTARRNAGGTVILRIDDQGCALILPAAQFTPGLEYVLEDQADTAGLSWAFVRGYVHEVTTPVCGQTRVFHLLSKN